MNFPLESREKHTKIWNSEDYNYLLSSPSERSRTARDFSAGDSLAGDSRDSRARDSSVISVAGRVKIAKIEFTFSNGGGIN